MLEETLVRDLKSLLLLILMMPLGWSKMSGADILFGPNHSVFTGPANSFSVPAKKTIRVILIGGGGGGGAGGMTYQRK